MDHYRLSDELRQQLLENAAWGKAGVTPRLDESETEERLTHGIDEQQGGRKTKKKARKPEEAEEMEDHTDYEDAEGSEELEEAVHVCPLCVSQLDQPLDEESILEHLNVVMGLVDRLTQLQEGEEDIE